MKRLLLVAALFASSVPVSAFAQEDRNFMIPHRHWFGTMTLQFDSTDEESITGIGERDIVMAAANTWAEVACTEQSFANGGVVGNISHNFSPDGVSSIIFNQPCEPGVLAYNTRFQLPANTETLNNRTWQEITETDTSFCEDIVFGTPAEVDSPQCVGLYDMQGIALHELGHGLGYDHTCEADESCGDPELRGAVMYWAVGACDGGQRTPNSYDIETHSISYGLGGSSDLTVAGGSGGLPLEVTFTPVVIASASILSVDWDFGDATEETTAGSATHTYTAEGRYSVGATIHANSPACGGNFTQQVRKTDVVVACNDLEPDFRYEKDGKKVKFFSETLGTAAGCLQVLSWDFGDGATANVKNPIHEYSSAGSYTVSLTASGPPGTSAPYTREVKVSSGGGGGLFGCSVDGEGPTANSAAAAGVLCIAVAMSLATVSRRRAD